MESSFVLLGTEPLQAELPCISLHQHVHAGSICPSSIYECMFAAPLERFGMDAGDQASALKFENGR